MDKQIRQINSYFSQDYFTFYYPEQIHGVAISYETSLMETEESYD